MPRPSLDPTLTEQSLRFIGWSTIVLAGVFGAVVGLLYAGTSGLPPWFRVAALPAGVITFVGAALSSTGFFAAAEALGYLRRQEERALILEWEAERAAAAARRAQPR